MINKTVRGMAVLAAAGMVWLGAVSATADTTADATVVSAGADVPGGVLTLHPGRVGEGDDRDRGHACVTTTAWGTGDCPHKRLN
ncbi:MULTISPECIES: hypothetical protein [unclassified Streptomyces]|uniref:hypothetical protein n=1 Tax=unclassified Streptomyces TaxID=2593676 RepID=UPI0004C936D6|nr:hypothetical protein [Streptomyces sp. NRRL F-2747]